MSKLRNAGAILCLLVCVSHAWGQKDACEIRHVRMLEADDYFNEPSLVGVVFPPRANSVLMLDQPMQDGGTLVLVPPGGRWGDADTLSLEISDPINITFDARANRLFLFERESNELVVVHLRGRLKSPTAIQRIKADAFGVEEPSGMAVDPKTGALFVLDRVGPKIVQVDPGSSRKNYDPAAAQERARISERFVKQRQPVELRGLGFNPTDGSLYVFSPTRQALFKITEDGALARVGDFPGFDRIDLKGVVFVPSLDQTDDPRHMNLYIASSGGPNGQVSEWSLTPCVQRQAQKKHR